MRLAVAETNRSYFVLMRKVAKKFGEFQKERPEIGFDSIDMPEVEIQNEHTGGQNTPDAFLEGMVDSLAVWLKRAIEYGAQETAAARDHISRRAAMGSMAFSMEWSLRFLWQHALWQRWEIVTNQGAVLWGPTDRELEELWQCWVWREGQLHAQIPIQEVATSRLQRQLTGVRKRADFKTVIGLREDRGKKREFLVGRVREDSGQAIARRTELELIEKSHLRSFLTIPLPVSADTGVGILDLLSAWHVLRDLSEHLLSPALVPKLHDDQSISELAMSVKRSEVAGVIGKCCDIPPRKAESIVDFLSTDPKSPDLFKKGIWARPLIKIAEDRLLIVLAALRTDAPIRRAELWLARCGIEEEKGVVGKGHTFEAEVIRRLSEAKQKSKLLSSIILGPHRLAGDGDSEEEIDLLFMLGDLLVVGEVKCWLIPMEASERFNYQRRLAEATEQAKEKATWLKDNPQRAAKLFGVDIERIKSVTMVPLVILNQGFGMGYRWATCPIVDLHYLELYLSDSSFVSGARYDFRANNVAWQHHSFYSNASEAVARFRDEMADPVVIKWQKNRVRWDRTKLPTAEGQDMEVEGVSAEPEKHGGAEALRNAFA